MLAGVASIASLWYARLGIIGVLVIQAGLSFDVLWHRGNELREHYFILPHIVIYVGIILLLLSAALLRRRGVRLPLWVFVIFPLLSLFDEFWHRTFGVELATSPLMFWSPAHWSFMIAVWYVLHQLYIRTKTALEQFDVILLETLLYFVIPIRFVAFMLAPLGPFSPYESLVGGLSILVPILIVFVYVTMHEIVRNNTLILPAALFLASSDIITRCFAMVHPIYRPGLGQAVMFIVVGMCVSSLSKNKYRYHLFAASILAYMLGMRLLQGGSIEIINIGWSLLFVLIAAELWSRMYATYGIVAQKVFLHTIAHNGRFREKDTA